MEYELYHWGIKGMKWGIRRFQNKDGSLTPAGRKRYEDGDGSSGRGKSKTAKAKSNKDLTDDELRAKISRLTLEKQALDLEKQLNTVPEKKVSSGKEFLRKIGNDVIVPSLTSAGKSALTKFLTGKFEKALGVSGEDVSNALELLKGKKLSQLSDSQINSLKKRYENISTIKKGMNDEKTVDDQNNPSSRQDQENTIKKGMKDEKSVDSSSGTKVSESTKSSSSVDKQATASSSSSSKTASTETEPKATVSNSNARSVHDIYQSMTKGQNWIVDNLYSSGYKMTSVSQLERTDSKKSGQISNGKAFVSTIGDYKMRSLEDIEKYN